MSKLTIKGKIVNILEKESGTSKAGKEWNKQSFVIDTGAEWNPEVCFSLFGDEKIAMLENFAEGQDVDVAFNLSSREFNGKYYHNIDAWKIDLVGEVATAPKNDSAPAEEDDLPF